MGGVYIAVVVSLLSLAATLLKTAIDLIWRPVPVGAPEWLGWLVFVISALAALTALLVFLVAIGKGPAAMARLVERLLSSPETRRYPDMPLAKVVQRACPHIYGWRDTRNRAAGEYERCGTLLNEIRQHGRLGRLTLWGRHMANATFEEHTPLSEIPADFWQEGDLDYLQFLEDGKGKAERHMSRRENEWFADIWLNER